jgi:hypothetical protein
MPFKPNLTITNQGSVLGNAENAAWGLDNIGDSRLGFIKKAGYAPVIASSSGAPIVFSQTNQSGIFTNISGATLTERMRINSDGNVGIGTTDPGSFKLAVNGKTWSTEVQVAVNRPPDYVFEPTYDLKPLAEIETYIKENKHLPEVPSAKEMEANGVQLGEMNMLLLKKVEELTLYLIDMKEENEQMKKEIKEIRETKRGK